MPEFKRWMTAGLTFTAAVESTTLNGAVLVDNNNVQPACDGALLAWDRLAFEARTLPGVLKLPP
ncbi:MAG TPA: hypothetical protein VIG54_08410 [Lysobacter sp.]